MAGVLGDMGADWHTLENSDAHTAYDMLKVAALRAQFVPGPKNTATVDVPKEVKRALRSLPTSSIQARIRFILAVWRRSQPGFL